VDIASQILIGDYSKGSYWSGRLASSSSVGSYYDISDNEYTSGGVVYQYNTLETRKTFVEKALNSSSELLPCANLVRRDEQE
jgi:hypothetical protein